MKTTKSGIDTSNQEALNNRMLVINRDNAGRYMEKYISNKKVSQLV